jgi:hypothetical protein
MIYYFLIIGVIVIIFVCCEGVTRSNEKEKQDKEDDKTTKYSFIWTLRDLVDEICTYHEERGMTKKNPLYDACCTFIGEQQENFKKTKEQIGWAETKEGDFDEEFFMKYYYYKIIEAFTEVSTNLANYPITYSHSYYEDMKEIIKRWKEKHTAKLTIGENPINTIQL